MPGKVDPAKERALIQKYDILIEGPIRPRDWPKKYAHIFGLVRETEKVRYEEYLGRENINDNAKLLHVAYMCNRTVELVEKAHSLRESLANEGTWRLGTENLILNRFQTDVNCHVCNHRLWISDSLAVPSCPVEATRLNDIRDKRNLCRCSEIMRAKILTESPPQKPFIALDSCAIVDMGVMGIRKGVLPSRKPDCVLGLRKNPELEELVAANPGMRATVIKNTMDTYFPFLVLEAKSEKETVGFESIERQTAFPIRAMVDLQKSLKTASTPPMDPLVWFLANRGDEWRVYGCVPDQSRTRVIDLWHGSILRHDSALQLLLIIDLLCDWARDIFTEQVIRSLQARAGQGYTHRASQDNVEEVTLSPPKLPHALHDPQPRCVNASTVEPTPDTYSGPEVSVKSEPVNITLLDVPNETPERASSIDTLTNETSHDPHCNPTNGQPDPQPVTPEVNSSQNTQDTNSGLKKSVNYQRPTVTDEDTPTANPSSSWTSDDPSPNLSNGQPDPQPRFTSHRTPEPILDIPNSPESPARPKQVNENHENTSSSSSSMNETGNHPRSNPSDTRLGPQTPLANGNTCNPTPDPKKSDSVVRASIAATQTPNDIQKSTPSSSDSLKRKSDENSLYTPEEEQAARTLPCDWARNVSLRSDKDVRFMFRSISLPETSDELYRIIRAIPGDLDAWQKSLRLFNLLKPVEPLIIEPQFLDQLKAAWGMPGENPTPRSPPFLYASLNWRATFDNDKWALTNQLTCITASIPAIAALATMCGKSIPGQVQATSLRKRLIHPLRYLPFSELLQAASQRLFLNLEVSSGVATAVGWVADDRKAIISKQVWAALDSHPKAFTTCHENIFFNAKKSPHLLGVRDYIEIPPPLQVPTSVKRHQVALLKRPECDKFDRSLYCIYALNSLDLRSPSAISIGIRVFLDDYDAVYGHTGSLEPMDRTVFDILANELIDPRSLPGIKRPRTGTGPR